jgi:TPR repeat protein
LEPQALLGSGPAMLALGRIYDSGGHGVERRPEIAHYWYEKAYKEDNSAEATLRLAQIYYFGRGYPINYEKAFEYCKKLEKVDFAKGLFLLAMMYASGKGVNKDKKKARELNRRSAKLGHVWARHNLGVLELMRGNIFSGIIWWSLAAIQIFFLSIFKPDDPRITF